MRKFRVIFMCLRSARRTSVLLGITLVCLVAAVWLTRQATAVPVGLQARQLLVTLDRLEPPWVEGAKVRTSDDPALHLAGLLAQHNHVPLVLRERSLPHVKPLADQAAVVLTYSPATRASWSDSEQKAYRLPIESRPMAIMRSDTRLRAWVDLADRTVCVSRNSRHRGYAASYGASEIMFPAPADALLALRRGACDAAVHEAGVLQAMTRLPEWAKFSASLPLGQARSLHAVLPGELSEQDEQLLKQLRQLVSASATQAMYARVARDIAFEVYLDQVVEDCH